MGQSEERRHWPPNTWEGFHEAIGPPCPPDYNGFVCQDQQARGNAAEADKKVANNDEQQQDPIVAQDKSDDLPTRIAVHSEDIGVNSQQCAQDAQCSLTVRQYTPNNKAKYHLARADCHP
jgi:hypothetical protein